MRWPAAMAFAAFLAGCHSAPPAFDPFLPKTRIPPPPTGAATGAPDAYYTSPAPPYTGGAPAYPPPTTGGSDLYGPPGSYPYQQPTPTPAASGYGPTPGPVNRSSQSAPAKVGLSGRQGAVLAASHSAPPKEADENRGEQNVPAHYLADAATSSAGESRAMPASHSTTVDNEPSAVYEQGASTATARAQPQVEATPQSVDLMDLPPVNRSQRQTVRKPLAEAVAGARYDYDSDYRWLRGQLEFTPDGGPLRLRYIPLDGPADKFGGSVLLDGKLPRQYRPGDFIVVEGQPETAPPAGGAEALYRVAAVERQPD